MNPIAFDQLPRPRRRPAAGGGSPRGGRHIAPLGTAALALALAVTFALFRPVAAEAGAPDTAVVAEILDVLRDRGLIDDDRYESLAARYAQSEQERESALPKLYLWGDFRARYEGFWFDSDATGNERENRHRGRYRMRLNGRADVNDWMQVLFRISSSVGRGGARSTNDTFDGGFDRAAIGWDRAYVRMSPALSEHARLALEIGKVPNPLIGQDGKDALLWDADINLEGGQLRFAYEPRDDARLYAHAGFYVIDENSRGKDPKLVALQMGTAVSPLEHLEVGARLTGYLFSSLDAATINAAEALGNVFSPRDRQQRIGEFRGHVKYDGIADWPLTVYGSVARNFDGEGPVGLDRDVDLAWSVGFEAGHKARIAQLGLGYFSVEANAFPAFLIDSNILDGRTNREGFILFGSRRIATNAELKVTLFLSEEIEDDLRFFRTSVTDADRTRLQVDLNYKFK